MKAFCALWLIAGLFVLFRTDGTYSNTDNPGWSLIVVVSVEGAATILGSAMFAFFAYVLDLFRGIWEESAGEND